MAYLSTVYYIDHAAKGKLQPLILTSYYLNVKKEKYERSNKRRILERIPVPGVYRGFSMNRNRLQTFIINIYKIH